MGKGKQKKPSQIKTTNKTVNTEASQDLPMTTQGKKPMKGKPENQKK
ncbi:MAG: hypothetical protein AB6733_14400 [Clostridiaceae bacterium]